MKKIIACIGAVVVLGALVFGLILWNKKDTKSSGEVAKELYDVNVDENITSKGNPEAICILCEDGYFPDYLTGKVIEDKYGNLLLTYDDEAKKTEDVGKLQNDKKVLYAEEIGKNNVEVAGMAVSTYNEVATVTGHLSYAYEQFNSDVFIKNCKKDKVIIGVVDTGVDYTHPYIADYIDVEKCYDFVNGKADVFEDGSMDDHATAVDSNIIDILAGGSDDLDFQIINYKGLEADWGSYYDISNCIRKAADDGCNIINCSFGSPYYNALLASAIQYACDKGVIVVAAAGNEYANELSYPAALSTTISVGSIRENYEHSDFSNLKADYSAAGENILSATPGESYKWFNGTSMATPNLVGMCAILYSQGYTDIEDIREQLNAMCVDLGDAGWDEYYGNGIPRYEEKQEEPNPEKPDEETPSAEEPDEETLSADEPDEETSSAEEPDEETPSADEPDEETPSADEPDEETPSADQPNEETPSADEPDEETPSAEEPNKETPSAEEPDTEPSTPEKPIDKPDEPEKVVLEEITIYNMPNKIRFYVGDRFEYTGLSINLIYSDGSVDKNVSSGINVHEPLMSNAGTYSVKVQYENCYTSYNITIETPTIEIMGGESGGNSTNFTAVTNPQINNVVWSSSDTNLATVNNGTVTIGNKTGNAVITASVLYNGIEYKAEKIITVGYSNWSTLGDYRFAKEATSDLKQETVHTLYFWYWFQCNHCGYHSSHWNINCPTCGHRIPFEGVRECYAPQSYDIAGNASYARANISGEVLIKDVNNNYYNSSLNNEIAYVHESKLVKTAYRYLTREYVIESIR